MIAVRNGAARAERMLELGLVAIVAAGLTGLALAAIGAFKALQIILVGLLAMLLYARLVPAKRVAAASSVATHLVLLLLIALLFRIPAFNYVSGGQDQGVYVNVAAHIAQTEGFAFSDPVAARLAGSSAEPAYKADNAPVAGDFLLGLFQREVDGRTVFQFQFYHLFPVLMALVGATFGLDNGVVALTVLSLLSVAFFYLLVRELTGRDRLALGAALLLALNPLHAFFSRFPVAEVPALCFVLAAMWLLARAWRAREDAKLQRWCWIVLSSGALACTFLTRMTGFMYMPIILLIGAVACLREADLNSRRLVVAWVFMANAIYAATVIYGYVYSSFYAGFELEYSFQRLFGTHWAAWVLGLWSGGLAVLAALYVAPTSFLATWVERLLEYGRRWLGFAIIGALALWLYKLHSLGWTPRYLADPWMANRWHMAGVGTRVFAYSSLVVAAEYVGPLLLLLFFCLGFRRRLDGPAVIVLTFATMFLFYVVGPQWLVAYQPYYARYLLSEFIPAVILFVALAMPGLRLATQRAIGVILVLSGLWAAVLAAGQLRAHEQQGMAHSYASVAAHVGDDDLLLLDTTTLPLPHQLIEMPFLLRYQRHVARISEQRLSDIRYLNALQGPFDRLFMLSGSAAAPPGFMPVDSIRFREWVARQGRQPTTGTELRFQGRTFLYVRPAAVIVPGEWKSLGTSGNAMGATEWNRLFGAGWSVPEPWGIWSDADEARIELPRAFADGGPVRLLSLQAKPFVTQKHPRQRVRTIADGVVVFDGVLAAPTTLHVPLDPREAGDHHVVRLQFPDAVTPADAGLPSPDPRKLGIGVLSARLDGEKTDQVSP